MRDFLASRSNETVPSFRNETLGTLALLVLVAGGTLAAAGVLTGTLSQLANLSLLWLMAGIGMTIAGALPGGTPPGGDTIQNETPPSVPDTPPLLSIPPLRPSVDRRAVKIVSNADPSRLLAALKAAAESYGYFVAAEPFCALEENIVRRGDRFILAEEVADEEALRELSRALAQAVAAGRASTAARPAAKAGAPYYFWRLLGIGDTRASLPEHYTRGLSARALAEMQGVIESFGAELVRRVADVLQARRASTPRWTSLAEADAEMDALFNTQPGL